MLIQKYKNQLLLCMLSCVFSVGIWHGYWEYMDSAIGYERRFPAATQEDKNKIRIVTVGESTTARIHTHTSWPEYLESELNRRAGKDVYRVYNLGVSGTVSSRIYHAMPRWIATYNPQIVISMMGINDVNLAPYPVKNTPITRLVTDVITNNRIYRYISFFFRLLAGNKQATLIRDATLCGRDAMGEREWRRLAETPVGTAEKNTLDFVRRYPFSYHGYESIIDLYIRAGRFNEAQKWVMEASNMEPYIRLCGRAFSKNSKVDMVDIITNIDNAFIYIRSTESVIREAKSKGGLSVSGNAAESQNLRTVDTIEYYPKISELLKDHAITHIAMQYPLLPVIQLKEYLSNNTEVYFVSNEQNFQSALDTHQYDDLFIDHFAGVFGHTTDLGAKLIASSAADVVLSLTSRGQ